MKPEELYPYIEKNQPNICQISVLQNGQEIWSGEWNGYRKTDCTHIMSATKSVMSFLIGIAKHKNYFAESAEEHKHFTIDKAPRQNVWLADSQGIAAPGYGLCMSASDMARLGQLCLQNGAWNGEQIVSAKWITEMLTPRAVEDVRFRGMHYGYLWWIVHPERNIYAAVGDSGNVIYVDPNRSLTAAVSSYFRPAVFDRVDFIENALLPALRENERIEMI